MRASFFGPSASTSPHDEAACRGIRLLPRTSSWTSATPTASSALFARARAAISSSSSTPPRSRRTTGPPRTPHDRLHRQRQRHAEPARGDARRTAGGDVRLHARRTRSTATGRTACRCEERDDAARAAGGPSLLRRHRHVDVDRPVAALAVRRLEGRRRPARPGVRPLLRHADRLLPRRLPHRPEPCRRPAARLPRLPDAVHGHRHAVHGLRLRRQAGARQHPQRRPRARLRGLPREPARRRPSTTSAAGARSNCSMLEAIALCERIAGRELDWTLGDDAADRRPPLVDQRPRPFRADYPGWRLEYGVEAILRRSTSANVERWTAVAA